MEVPAALLRSQLSAALSGISCAASQVPPQAFKVFPELYCRTGDICLAHAIVPDFAILHAARADFAGNVQLDPIENGLMSGDLLYARAAKQSLVSVEQIVTKEAIVINEKQTVLHAAQDPLLIEAPYGAYPCGYVSRYSADNAGWPNIGMHRPTRAFYRLRCPFSRCAAVGMTIYSSWASIA